ncbi:MAG: hypothetical protein ACD_46C00272G0001, partial [uncultured bacterium]
MRTVEEYIGKLNLQRHPEGGYFSEIYRSTDKVIPLNDRYRSDNKPITRDAGTSIYFLLDKTDYSAWHVLKSDEIWHFYDGSPMHIHTIDEQGELKTHILGNPCFTDG